VITYIFDFNRFDFVSLKEQPEPIRYDMKQTNYGTLLLNREFDDFHALHKLQLATIYRVMVVFFEIPMILVKSNCSMKRRTAIIYIKGKL
jgi:hypothetical protein